jgi:threonine aldolase
VTTASVGLLSEEERTARQGGIVELRSDTFTLPSAEMISAIASAKLGNDGYHEDPTVRELEALTAEMLGKQAASLMPSGTMANLTSILFHCAPAGGTVLVGDLSDIYVYEDRRIAERFGVVFQPLKTGPDGVVPLESVEKGFADARGRVRLLCLENPHNLCGGVILPDTYLKDAARILRQNNAKLHLDGARIFNASVALGTPVRDLVAAADSVQFCLSKGLSAPVGSMVAADREAIEEIRKYRSALGGGMRQSGIIAAPGIIALTRMVDRMADDHRNAALLADGLRGLPGVTVVAPVQTNTVVFRVSSDRFPNPEAFIQAAARLGLNLSPFQQGRIRAVTHFGITPQAVESALQRLRLLLLPAK